MNRYALLIASIILLTGLSCTQQKKEKGGKAIKTAYILPGKVYQAYPPAKAYQKKMQNVKQQQRGAIDTMRQRVKALKKKLVAGEGDTKALRKRYQRQQKQLQQRVQRVKRGLQQRQQKFSDSIWKELNQHIKAFGREKGYDYIYGASGQGNLMYADSTLNVTQKVIDFVNARYDSIQSAQSGKKDSLKQ